MYITINLVNTYIFVINKNELNKWIFELATK